MINNTGILKFVESSKWLHHRREYAYGTKFPLVEQLGVVPPFQFSRDLDETGMQNLTLVRYSDGTEYSAQIPMQLTGLGGETIATAGNETGYIHTTYPGSAALPISGLVEGLHYLRFEDDMGNFFLSELFSWMQGIENRRDFLKLEWWHNEDITFSGSRISYDFPYKQRIWLPSDIGKPDYQVVEKVVSRDGVDFPTQTISYKVHKFAFYAPEHILDSMMLVTAHDNKVVTHMGKVIGEGNFDKIYSFLMTPEWLEVGDVANVEVEFRTNKVVIVNGRGYDELDYEVAEGGCLTANYEATAWIDDGSAEFAGGYWTDEFGANHSFVAGEYAVVVVGGFDVLRQWNGSNFIAVTIGDRETIHTVHDSRNPYVRGSEYFFKTSAGAPLSQVPIILTNTNISSVYTLTGETFENSLIEVWLRGDDEDVLAATFTDDDFETGIEFDASGYNAFMLRARTYICENLGETEWETFEGIGWWELENDFEVQPDPAPPTPEGDDEM